jgi:hypothetical protein
LALTFFTACKLNKDGNCLNPKAGCFVKDAEKPSVVGTTPASQPTVASPTPVPTLNTVIIDFSEPMKNADNKGHYSFTPIGGTASLTLNSVTRLNDRRYQLNFSGGVGTATSVQFDLSLLTDLSDNTVSPTTFTIPTSTIGAVPDTVTSSGGYTETNITWTNTTPYAMTYVIKVGGADCAGATAITGTNVSGTALSNATVITNAGFAQFAVGANTVRVCLTPVTTGTATSFTVTVNRDDTAPSLAAMTAMRVKIPHAITLTCSDNVDRIAYTIDGTVPGFTVNPTGTNIGATLSGNSLLYSIGSGYTLTTRGAVNFQYRCIDKAGHLNTEGVRSATLQSKMVWDETNWSAPAAAQPYDTWD